jgi:hypothetical protein
MKTIMLLSLLACAVWAGPQYVAGYTDASGVVRGYGYTDNAALPSAPDGMTPFVVPVSKFKESGSMFKLQSGEIKAMPQTDIDAAVATKLLVDKRQQLYAARERLEAMRLELTDSPDFAGDIQGDIDTQAALVAQLRKDLTK